MTTHTGWSILKMKSCRPEFIHCHIYYPIEVCWIQRGTSTKEQNHITFYKMDENCEIH